MYQRLVQIVIRTNSKQTPGKHTILVSSKRFTSNGTVHVDRLVTPYLEDFPQFLKNIESKWRIKLMRRFDREQYVGNKEEEAARGYPRYILSMFPYPSGRLHLGHVRIYTSGDILARYSRLLCKNKDYQSEFSYVINPMGFDSFGLPAENAARERGLNPAVWTNTNIRAMKQQLDDLALQFDWREATSNPSFYKWTQDLFLRLMDAGLVYKSYSRVNWDPVDKTVLADEQVDGEGRSWRSGAQVERRNLRQWFIKTNAFAEEIYKADHVEPESWRDVLDIQRNWVGKPTGWLFYLPIQRPDSRSTDTLAVFTEAPELFMRSETELVLAHDHWLESVHNISGKGYIRNPFNGNKLRVTLTHKVEDLPASTQATIKSSLEREQDEFGRSQILLQAKLNGLGGYHTSDRYRDWLISRQRFWGTPIPVIECNTCGVQPVPRDLLPVKLPLVEDLSLKSDKDIDYSSKVGSAIDKVASLEWKEVDCPSCGRAASRDCETFDTLFDSSWYFLRYASSPIHDKPFNPDRVQPVWCYIGGIEHASMHLFYARFITHFLHSQGQLKFKEPFEKLLVQGVVKSKTYKVDGRYLTKSELDSLDDKIHVSIEYEKMSKSKGNGVDPQDLLDTYGIDATRFCLMSYANPRTERLWRSNKEEFREVLSQLRRITLAVQEYADLGLALKGDKEQQIVTKIKELDNEKLELKKSELIQARNRASIDATFHIEQSNQFRQYISVLHVLIRIIRSNQTNSVVYSREFAEALATMIVLLNPLTPHLSEELWTHFIKCVINPLRTALDSPYNAALQLADQPWPLPDANFPLPIKIRLKTDESVDIIPISRDNLRILSNEDITSLVESHFSSKNDQCKVTQVVKYHDLMAIVIADVESVNQKLAKKRKKLTSES